MAVRPRSPGVAARPDGDDPFEQTVFGSSSARTQGRSPVDNPVDNPVGSPPPRRRVSRQRPAGRFLDYGSRGNGLRVSRAPHATSSERVSLGTLLVIGLLTAMVVIALFGAAQLRITGPNDVPQEVALVQVQPGESLGDVAVRVAPDAPIGAVVQRIVELNDLPDSSVHPGQSLLAPVSGA